MTDHEQALEAIARAASELVKPLTERLTRYGLGEIEVSTDDLQLRVARAAGAPAPGPAPDADSLTSEAQPTAARSEQSAAVGVASPAVGFFVYADGLGPGLEVEKGDALGHIEMLGIRHDVRAPRGGTVRNLVAESGEAVEYGQVVLELEHAAARA